MTTSSKLEVDDERDEFFIISTGRQTDRQSKKTTYDKQIAEWRERERESSIAIFFLVVYRTYV